MKIFQARSQKVSSSMANLKNTLDSVLQGGGVQSAALRPCVAWGGFECTQHKIVNLLKTLLSFIT